MDYAPWQPPIFLVDDDSDAGLLIGYSLQKSGITNPLRIWMDPAEALADWTALESSRPQEDDLPLLLLVDLKMPKISGYDLLAWLRDQRHLGTRPRIVMTSSIDRRDAQISQDLGAHGFLTKYPTSFVLAAIARFAHEHRPEAVRDFAEFGD